MPKRRRKLKPGTRDRRSMGQGRPAQTAPVTLYRVMCEVEFQRIMKTGHFGIVPGSLQGKWFAERPEHAAAWGVLFETWLSIPHRRIVKVEIDVVIADRLFRLENLDGIGPARFATLLELRGARIEEYTP
jgi:hypothetical protein